MLYSLAFSAQFFLQYGNVWRVSGKDISVTIPGSPCPPFCWHIMKQENNGVSVLGGFQPWAICCLTVVVSKRWKNCAGFEHDTLSTIPEMCCADFGKLNVAKIHEGCGQRESCDTIFLPRFLDRKFWVNLFRSASGEVSRGVRISHNNLTSFNCSLLTAFFIYTNWSRLEISCVFRSYT